MPESAIQLKNVSVSLHGTAVLRDISVKIGAGQITGCIGPSGAGKTTLVRTIVGRQRAASGSIDVLGQPAGGANLRGRFGYMTQTTAIYNDLTVRQNLYYFATIAGTPRRTLGSSVDDLLATVDLKPQADQLGGQLSGGQRQRVSLAIALIGYPPLLVLDEPTVGLDPVLREQLWQLFRRLAGDGTTILLTSHAMDEAERCDDLLLVRDGRLLAHDAPAALCRRTGSHTVEQSFLKLVETT